MKTLIYFLMLAWGLLPVHPQSLKPLYDFFFEQSIKQSMDGQSMPPADLNPDPKLAENPAGTAILKERNEAKTKPGLTDLKQESESDEPLEQNGPGYSWDNPEKKEKAVSSSLDLDGLRQSITVMKIRLEEGEHRLQDRYNSLINQRDPDWMAKSAVLDEKRKMNTGKLVLLGQADELFRQLQEEMALPKPDPDELPEEVMENLIGSHISLPHQVSDHAENQGAPGGGPGFARACPAFDQPGNENFEEGSRLDAADGSFSLNGGSSGLILPASGYVSAGTWTYPNGGMHLGMDLALSMFTPVHAPADGIILYAASVTGDGGGYLGNWSGWPYGGGNTIAMICKSRSHLFGVTFCHLSSRIRVRAGQQVHQGDLLAYSGNTGNSTGPHTHIELFDLKVSLDQAIAFFRQGADFSFGTGWSAPATCSAYACRVRPELYFGH